MSRDRIKDKFGAIEREQRPGLVIFLTVGFPDLAATSELVPALAAAGADIIELGVPFSDPLAEGPVIQESSFRALQNGTSLEDCLNLVDQLREQVPDTPLVLMGYYNPIFSYGLEKFCDAARRVGVDGLIVVDLPHQEMEPLARLCAPRGIHIVPLLAPTSSDASIKASVESTSGFVYCISLTGVTGVRNEVSQRGFDLLKRVRKYTATPLSVGFGISSRKHVEEVCARAEAAVVGSALVRVMLESPREQLVERSCQLVAELAGKSFVAQGESGS
ncbi:MAG: tryptophan synthase subunit alpha [Dehalococcoidia bacterium]